jgi:hypothetical protein
VNLDPKTLIAYRRWLQHTRGKRVTIQFWDETGHRGSIAADASGGLTGELNDATKFQIANEPQVTRTHFEQVIKVWASSLTGKRSLSSPSNGTPHPEQ